MEESGSWARCITSGWTRAHTFPPGSAQISSSASRTQLHVEIETDKGETVQGHEAERTLIADRDLDLLATESRSPYPGKAGRKPGKLVHNIVLSMPAGTPPARLLAASREFAREELALKHRYAMVLHTDQDHPHVHLVVKAVSEEGRRLNIRKATLRAWRRQFAAQLRAQGVAANATERAVRGQVRPPMGWDPSCGCGANRHTYSGARSEPGDDPMSRLLLPTGEHPSRKRLQRLIGECQSLP
jgi:hypothetical protein